MMKLLTLGVLAGNLAGAGAAAAQPVAPLNVKCDGGPAAAAGPVNLHGNWDFLMDVGGSPSFGLLSIGWLDGGYGGSLTPVRTAPVVLRSIRMTGDQVHMIVASPEGDVLFDGNLSSKGDRICGTVTYHGGQTFPMIAQRRPSTYQTPPRQQPAR